MMRRCAYFKSSAANFPEVWISIFWQSLLGPSQPADPVPLQSDEDKSNFKDWLQRPEEWDATATWAWGLPSQWYSALRWWVLKDGSCSEYMLLDVAETETLDLVWLSTTRVSLYMTRTSGTAYIRDITAPVCAGMKLAMAAAWEGKGNRRPRPTAAESDVSRSPGSARTPTRLQQGRAAREDPGMASPLHGEEALTGRGSPSLTSEEQDGSMGSRVAAGRDRRIQETTDRLLPLGDSPHLPTAGRWSASPFQQQVSWVWAEHQQQELYRKVTQRVAELGKDMFEAPTSAQWMWDTLIGGVVTWQKQREDISSQLQQVYLYRLDEETQMVRMEIDFLRDKAKVADWAGWQDTLRHALSPTERVQTRHLMPTHLLC
jgi:hypothetical protein